MKNLKKISRKKIIIVSIIFFILSGGVVSNLTNVNWDRTDKSEESSAGVRTVKIDLGSTDQYKAYAFEKKNVQRADGTYPTSDFPESDRCKIITISNPNQRDIFIPFKTRPEWESFLENAPYNVSGLTLSECSFEYTLTTSDLQRSSDGYYYVDLDNVDAIKNKKSSSKIALTIPRTMTLIAPSTSSYALKTGSGYELGLEILNYGKIYGRGGNGGSGGNAYNYSTKKEYSGNGGQSGGYAILVENNFVIKNLQPEGISLAVYSINGVVQKNTGEVVGGGGGGGGGGANWEYGGDFRSDKAVGGSGGGGGAPYGLGGSWGTGSGGRGGGANGYKGSNASFTAGGSGAEQREYQDTWSGQGGNGGAIGKDGTTAGYHGDGAAPNGKGGKAGAKYHNPNSFTITEE